MLKKYEIVLLILIAISLPMAMADYFAIRWGAWQYNPATTFNIHLPGELETYLFAVAVTIIIASSTLFLTQGVDRSKKRPRKNK